MTCCYYRLPKTRGASPQNTGRVSPKHGARLPKTRGRVSPKHGGASPQNTGARLPKTRGRVSPKHEAPSVPRPVLWGSSTAAYSGGMHVRCCSDENVRRRASCAGVVIEEAKSEWGPPSACSHVLRCGESEHVSLLSSYAAANAWGPPRPRSGVRPWEGRAGRVEKGRGEASRCTACGLAQSPDAGKTQGAARTPGGPCCLPRRSGRCKETVEELLTVR
jgi:hypothetical protein